jgi:hypothetical protein
MKIKYINNKTSDFTDLPTNMLYVPQVNGGQWL